MDLYASFLLITTFSWYLASGGKGSDIFNGVKDRLNVIREKIGDFKRLNRLVHTRNKSDFWSLWISFSMVCELYWLRFLQFIHTNVKHIDQKYALVSYTVNNHIYRMVVRTRKGPSVLEKVEDENGVDITSDVLPYYGPNNDWHAREFRPSYWGRKRLDVTVGSCVKSFEEHEVIRV